MKTKIVMKNFNIDATYVITLPCSVDEKDQVIEVWDYRGNLLAHNKEARQVMWNGKRLYY